MSLSKLLVPLGLTLLAASALALPAIQTPSLAPALLPATSAGAQQITLQFTSLPGLPAHVTLLGTFPVVSFQHSVLVPRDPVRGLATGKRQHQDITIVKYIDAASPRLAQAMGDGSVFPSATLTFLRQGAHPQTFTYVLSNVFITSIRTLAGGGSDARPLQELSLTYEKITLRYAPVRTRATEAPQLLK